MSTCVCPLCEPDALKAEYTRGRMDERTEIVALLRASVLAMEEGTATKIINAVAMSIASGDHVDCIEGSKP